MAVKILRGGKATLNPVATAVITTAVTALSAEFDISSYNAFGLQATLAYGSGGTTVKAFLQTSFDGTTWNDLMCFAFTTANARRIGHYARALSSQNPVVPTDASLADNTVAAVPAGHRARIKYVSTGTYAGNTTLDVRTVMIT